MYLLQERAEGPDEWGFGVKGDGEGTKFSCVLPEKLLLFVLVSSPMGVCAVISSFL